MMNQSVTIILFVSLFLAHTVMAGCTALPVAPEDSPSTTEVQTPASMSEDLPPVFSIASDDTGNEVAVSVEGETAIFDVRSERGIGSATVELVSGSPQTIVLRVHLQGLEEFRLMYNEVTLIASVSSRDVDGVAERVVLPDGAEQSLVLGDPLWIDIRIVSDQDVPSIPLDQGYFEVKLPNNFLNEARRTFSIRWIDFYR